MNGDDVADLIARQLPGWRLAAPASAPQLSSFADEVSAMRMDRGLSIAELKQKFLPVSAGDAIPVPSNTDFASDGEGVTTVRIEPEDGGPAKTADIRNGTITIVQG